MRYLRAHCTTRAPGYRFIGTLFTVETFNNKYLVIGIFVVLEKSSGIHILTVINIASIGRTYRFIHILLIIFTYSKLQTSATTDMIQPHFAGPQRTGAGKMFACYNVFSIGAPGSIIQQAKTFFSYLRGFTSIPVHHPDIITATGIRGK